ncbi:MAG TPA: aspartate kinase, partial [Alphaproteobacteria bacterium]|nr:aspartate kinase [Alphaproteobacteria bacterium]
MSVPFISTHPHTVEKIGGTSIAATEQVFDNVLIGERTGASIYNRIFVVSAYAGMTDLLLEHKKTGEAGVYGNFIANDADCSWEQALDAVEGAMLAKNAEIFDRSKSRAGADAFVDERIRELRDCLNNVGQLREHGHFRLTEPLADLREMLAAAGEAHSAHNTALLLRDRGVNGVFVDLSRWQGDRPSLDERILQGLKNIDLNTQLPIVTGYALCQGGMVSRYDRGYSEITFSRAAVTTGACEA